MLSWYLSNKGPFLSRPRTMCKEQRYKWDSPSHLVPRVKGEMPLRHIIMATNTSCDTGWCLGPIKSDMCDVVVTWYPWFSGWEAISMLPAALPPGSEGSGQPQICLTTPPCPGRSHTWCPPASPSGTSPCQSQRLKCVVLHRQRPYTLQGHGLTLKDF